MSIALRLRTRSLAVSSLVAALAVGGLAAPSAAATGHIGAHAVSLSFQVSTPIQVAGTISPKSTAAVELQRRDTKAWVTIAHTKPNASGAFALSVKAPSKSAGWTVRVVRPKAGSAPAVTGASFAVHIVKSAYAVTAVVPSTVVTGSPVTVTGKVAPKATGSVLLQTIGTHGWSTLASAKLGKASTFVVGGVLPLGAHRIRVLKAATAAVAQGLSKAATTTVQAATTTVAPPSIPTLSVGTTTLPDVVVASDYSVQLAATGGVPPYTFSAAGLPVGLTLSPGGVLSGRLSSVTSVTVTVTVTDSRLVAASASLVVRSNLSSRAANLGHGWGEGGSGELGDNARTQLDWPTTVDLTGITNIQAGQESTFGLRFNGDVWAWGDNFYGGLGVAPAALAQAYVPVQVPGLHHVTAIAAGSGSGYALTSDGTVWAWGSDTSGQLGNGTTNATANPVPVQVSGLTNVVAITAGGTEGYALKADGTVWAWGDNFAGELGNNSTTTSPVPVQVLGLSNITAISSNSNAHHLMALSSDGTVWTVGYNVSGQLGDNSTTNRSLASQVAGLAHVTAISAGGNDSYAVTGGTAWGWGLDAQGQIGDGATTGRSLPVPLAVSGVTAVYGGGQVAFAVRSDGTVDAWGYNGNGQIGDGTTTTPTAPEAISGLTNVLQMTGAPFTSYAVTGP